MQLWPDMTAAVGFRVLVCCRCVRERLKELQLVWIHPSRCRIAPSPAEGAHISKSQTSGPLVAPPLSYLFKDASRDAQSSVSVGMASVNWWWRHPSSGQRSQQSPVETQITKISVKWGYSKVSIDTSVRKRKRAKGQMCGCQSSLVEVEASARMEITGQKVPPGSNKGPHKQTHQLPCWQWKKEAALSADLLGPLGERIFKLWRKIKMGNNEL